jgi:hypothetical protein
MDPSNSSRLLLGTNQIYETTNKGNSWVSLSPVNSNGWNPNGDAVDALAVSKSAPNTIYATAGGHIFVTTDDGKTWTQHDIPTAADHFGDIEIDPTNSMVAYAVRDNFNDASNTGHVFKTTNGGANWTDITGNLPDIPTNSLALGTIQGNTVLFVGTDTGVFAAPGAGVNWSHYRTGMPNVRVSQLEINQGLNILAAGTHGRGMWEIQLGDALSVTVTPPTNATEGLAITNQKVATFSDLIGTDPISNYTVTIDWGDNTTSTGTVVADPNGGFDVQGSHNYLEEGSFTLSVTVKDSDSTSSTGTGPIVVADAPLAGTGTTLSNIQEGGTLTAVTLASFTDADPNGNLTDYTATIDWGDKTTTTGTIASNGTGGFKVTGSHTFAEGGSYTIKITINDAGASATVTDTISVADIPITVTGQAFSLAEGSTTPVVIATLSDPSPDNSPGQYTIAIKWGDNTTSTGFAVPTGGGNYNILGTHGFEEGTFQVSVQVTDLGGSTGSATSTATVTDAPITGSGTAARSLEGLPFSGSIGTITDSNPNAPLSDLTASITWGDGHTSAATLVAKGNGIFDVRGTNTYLKIGQYTIQASVTDVGGSKAQFQSTATVGDAPLTANGTALQAFEGVPFSGKLVTTFTDANPNGVATDFTATIDWGDGTTSAGTVAADPNGGFDVLGSHAFPTAGSPLIQVLIKDSGGATAQSIGTAAVQDAPLTSTGAVVFATEFIPATNLPVATFSDENTHSSPKDFLAVINWGDGVSSVGLITAKGNGNYSVTGNHTYNEVGAFPVRVLIQDVGGASTVAVSATSVANINLPIFGTLNPLSDSGVSNHDNITNVTRPNFTGFAQSNTLVQLFVVVSGQSTATMVGQGMSSAQNGAWSITTSTLADGTYVLFATSTDLGGHTAQPSILLPSATQGPLVIDTVGPHVLSSTFNSRTGQVSITFQDDRSGMNPLSLTNPANYSLSLNTAIPQPLQFTGLSISPSVPTGPVTAVASFRLPARASTSSFVFQMPALNVTDVAGNTLIERFFIDFPQLNNSPPGNYVAEFDPNGATLAFPQQFVPESARLAAENLGRFTRKHGKTRP